MTTEKSAPAESAPAPWSGGEATIEPRRRGWVVFLRDGRVLADGPPAAVVADAGHTTLEEMFLAEAVRLRGARL